MNNICTCALGLTSTYNIFHSMIYIAMYNLCISRCVIPSLSSNG